MIFGFSVPKNYEGAYSHEVHNNFIRYGKFKMADFWKKALKLPKFQISVSLETFRVKWKNFAYFCFLLVGTFEQKLIENFI